MTTPIHHIHKRKRIHQKHEKYPHPKKGKRYIDRIVYIFGIIGPLTGAAQSYKIWSLKEAAGLSIIMFGFGILNDMVWITYGAIHKEKPIILMYSLWLVVNIITVAGILVYG